MSAITTHEEDAGLAGTSKRGCLGCAGRSRGLGALGTVAPERRSLEMTHANLTRSIWIRRMIERALADKQVSVELGPTGSGELELVFVGGKAAAIPPDLVKYAPSVGKGFWHFSLWGESGKMGCPTWDLPSGSPKVGGSCPASAAGQTIVEPRERMGLLTKSGGRYFLKEKMPQYNLERPLPNGGRVEYFEGDEPREPWKMPICQECYAGGGNYRELNAAIGNVVRYYWTARLMQTRAGQQQWIDTVVQSMRLIDWYPVEQRGIKPVRVHSSGDFFAQAYMAAWIEVANRMARIDPSILFWAPTRSWASPKISPYWRGALDKLQQPNFVVRCSAFHMGDYAPGALHPDNAVGTTAVFRDDNKGDGADPRFDRTCPVYSKIDEGHTCQSARDPITGKPGCRMCWTAPRTRVNFTVHI